MAAPREPAKLTPIGWLLQIERSPKERELLFRQWLLRRFSGEIAELASEAEGEIHFRGIRESPPDISLERRRV